MTPDKVYCWRGVLGSFYCSSQKQKDVVCAEYINKDLLIARLTELMEQAKVDAGGCSNMHTSGKYIAYQEVIDFIYKTARHFAEWGAAHARKEDK